MLADSVSAFSSFHGTSALLTLLDDPCPEIQTYAVKNLLSTVSRQWFEIADYLPRLEEIREDADFSERELVSLILSMVYYHLNEYKTSIDYALDAGSKFDITSGTEYVQTVLSFCLDQYSILRSHNYLQEQLARSYRRTVFPYIDDDIQRPILSSHSPGPGDDVVDEEEFSPTNTSGSTVGDDNYFDDIMDTESMDVVREQTEHIYEPKYLPTDIRLETIINRLIDKCISDNKYKQAIGICLESKRLDALQKVITVSNNIENTLLYVIECVSGLLSSDNRNWHNDVIDLVVNMYGEVQNPNYFKMINCYIRLCEAKHLSDLLVAIGNKSLPMALQLTFDIYESSSQHFRSQLENCLQCERDRLIDIYRIEENKENPIDISDTDAINTIRQNDDIVAIERLMAALSGLPLVNMSMQFLIRNNHADLHLLKHTKDHARNMLCHSAVVIANGFMHCGTTCDQFLRDNLEWLGNATNWARFTATASLGVIHRYHEKEALRLMDAYLPKQSTTTLSPYAEGGGLYALGLIFANHGSGEIIKYVEDAVNESSSSVVKHGGCLGLGLLTLGTNNRHILSLMKELMSMNDAVVGEAVAIGMGMVMMGSRSRSVMSDLICTAEDTQHEKIARAASIGIALLCFNLREGCIKTLSTLCQHNNLFLRRAAMYGIGMAWIGSGQNTAVRKLLHFAVSDVSDDVRRAAVESIGFVMYKQSNEKIISIISLLIESYNPHVRYGSAIALGIAFAGSGNGEALKLIEPLTQDSTTFVRLGSFIAQAMIVADQPEVVCPQAKAIRLQMSKIIADKHEEIMAKYGAILAQGIVDACGRNASVSLKCPTTNLNCPQGAAGVLIFLHFWFWFPLTHMLSLAFKPSALMCITDKLQPPDMEILTSLPSNHFSYPASLAEQRRGTDKGEKVEAAVLSIRQRGGRQSKSGRSRHSKEAASSSTLASSTTSATVSSDNQPVQQSKQQKTTQVHQSEKNIIKLTEVNATEAKSSESTQPMLNDLKTIEKTSEKLSEDKLSEDKPSVDNPSEDKSSENKPSEDKPSEDKPSEDKPNEYKPSEDEPSENKPSEDKPSEDKPSEDKPSEDKPSEDKPSENKPSEDKPSEDKLNEPKLRETKQSDVKSNEHKQSVVKPSEISVTEKEKHATEKTPKMTKLRNLAVVRQSQVSSIIFPPTGRFRPVYLESSYGSEISSRNGMIVVVDKKPEAGTFKLMRMMKSSSLPKDDPKEPDPPEAFEFNEENTRS